MKAIIIEDEQLAANRLESLIKTCDNSIEIVTKLESVEESVYWFKNNPHPDLIFLDIHLEDGLSFSIFEKTKINVPVIFTTAFDEYAIRAFKMKGVDYLLKPISQEDLCQAINKYKDWTGYGKQNIDLNDLFRIIKDNKPEYRQRFSVTVGEKLKSIDVDDIAYFFSTSGITFVVMNSKSQYSIDLSLDKLAVELDPKHFYRINRQYLVRLKAIANVHIFPKSRLKLDLAPATRDEIFVSLDKVTEFKLWLDGGTTK
jgi:DNA-binding LytR/AlgR family response regulator